MKNKKKSTPKLKPVKVSHDWITEEIMAKGITNQTLNYLQNPEIKLKNLQTSEFLYLWNVKGVEFEKTRVFKKQLSIVINQAKSYDLSWPDFINQFPVYTQLIRKFAPFEMAVELCNDYWSLAYLFTERKLKGDNALVVFEKIIHLHTICSLKDTHLENFRYITGKEFEEYRYTADLLIDLHLRNNPSDYSRFVQPDMPLRRKINFCKAILDLIKTGSFFYYSSVDAVLRAFKKTGDTMFVDVVVKLIKRDVDVTPENYKGKSYYIAYSIMRDQINDIHDSELRKKYQEQMLPVTIEIAETMMGDEDSGGWIKTYILDLFDQLPVENTKKITQKVYNLLKSDPYIFDYCEKYYAYNKDEAWVSLFRSNMKAYGVGVSQMISFYRLTKESMVVLDYITDCLPKMKYINDSMVQLLEFLDETKLFVVRDKVKAMLPELLKDKSNIEKLPRILKYL